MNTSWVGFEQKLTVRDNRTFCAHLLWGAECVRSAQLSLMNVEWWLKRSTVQSYVPPKHKQEALTFFFFLLCVSQDGNVTKQTSHQVGCMHKAGGCLCSCDAFVAASCEFPDQFRVSAEACGFKCYNNNKQWNIFMQASGNQDPSFWRP